MAVQSGSSGLLRSPAARLRAVVDERDALPLVLELREVAPAAVLALRLGGRADACGLMAIPSGSRPAPTVGGDFALSTPPAPPEAALGQSVKDSGPKRPHATNTAMAR
jgi:hypothetical protein